MEPKIIRKGKLLLAGIMGDGAKTAQLWESFEAKNKTFGLDKKTESPYYEVRFDYDGRCDCFVGLAVADANAAEGFELLMLPESDYVSFDVVVANGYDSENANMRKWLDSNSDKYTQAAIGGKNFIVECYNERFKDGIVEIWIPLDSKQ